MQTVDINLIPGGVAPVVNVSQFDEGRRFALRVLNGHEEADLTGYTVSIEGRKKDGKVVDYTADYLVNGIPAVVVDGCVVTITTPLQMTAAAGKALMKLKLSDIEGGVIHTMKFHLDCDPDPEADGDISDSELPGIIEGARRDAARAEKAAQDAEDAVNSIGTAVEDAQEAARTATSNAESAEASARTATQGAAGASQSASAAAQSAGEASQSATDAASSARSAAQDAAQAAADRASASGSASAAGNSATNAVTALQGAQAAAQTATQKATEAAGSASSASASSDRAAEIVAGVEGKVAEAAASAEAAATSESNAATSARAAADSAAEAEQYAQGGLIYKRSVPFAGIPTEGMKAGDMYNIDEDFVTDDRFQEGAGVRAKAGTNIAWNGTKWDLLAVGGGGVEITDEEWTQIEGIL